MKQNNAKRDRKIKLEMSEQEGYLDFWKTAHITQRSGTLLEFFRVWGTHFRPISHVPSEKKKSRKIKQINQHLNNCSVLFCNNSLFCYLNFTKMPVDWSSALELSHCLFTCRLHHFDIFWESLVLSMTTVSELENQLQIDTTKTNESHDHLHTAIS